MKVTERESGDAAQLRRRARGERNALRRDRLRAVIAALVMDQAGWHKAKKLVVPGNIAILFLPPYSPELNPIENLWHCLRSHFLGNRVDDDYDHLLKAGAGAWRRLTPERLRSVCRSDYPTRGEQV